MEEISCAFTGHRNLNGELDSEQLERAVVSLIEKRGVSTFYNGMAKGFDLVAAKLILRLKKKYDLKLIACVPCRGQENGFSDGDKYDYNYVLERCDEVIVLSDYYYNGCMQERDRFMVDNAAVVLAYLREFKGGTFYTVNYARQTGKEIFVI